MHSSPGNTVKVCLRTSISIITTVSVHATCCTTSLGSSSSVAKISKLRNASSGGVAVKHAQSA